MKKIAILLTVFNRKELTIECLNNIFNQQLPPSVILTIFLTDDGSTDGTSKIIKEKFPNVKIIHGNGSLYWNRGMWTAWDFASKEDNFDAYLWLNNDTILRDNAINDMIIYSNHENNKCIIVGAVESSNGDQTTYGGYISGQRIDPNGELQKVDYFNGNVVLVPQYVYNLVGNLDYKYRHSFGDFDYGLIARKKGVSSYLTKNYVGKCDRHDKLNNWCNPNVPLKQRLHSLFLPTGYNPREAFYFEHKHYNIFIALFHQFTLWIRVFFPSLWIKMGHRANP